MSLQLTASKEPISTASFSSVISSSTSSGVCATITPTGHALQDPAARSHRSALKADCAPELAPQILFLLPLFSLGCVCSFLPFLCHASSIILFSLLLLCCDFTLCFLKHQNELLCTPLSLDLMPAFLQVFVSPHEFWLCMPSNHHTLGVYPNSLSSTSHLL